MGPVMVELAELDSTHLRTNCAGTRQNDACTHEQEKRLRGRDERRKANQIPRLGIEQWYKACLQWLENFFINIPLPTLSSFLYHPCPLPATKDSMISQLRIYRVEITDHTHSQAALKHPRWAMNVYSLSPSLVYVCLCSLVAQNPSPSTSEGKERKGDEKIRRKYHFHFLSIYLSL